MKRERFHPNINEIKQIIKDKDSPIYRDTDGRIYGFIGGENENGLREDLIRSGRLNTSEFMWVWLSTHRSGPFAKKKRTFGATDQILIGEDLIFLSIGDRVQLYDFYTDEAVGFLTVEEYPEQNYLKRRTDSVVVSLEFD